MGLLHDAVVAWAREQAAKQPTYEDYDWSPESRTIEKKTLPNTPEHVLAELLHRNFTENTDDRSAWEMAGEWAMNGVKGYKQMSLAELVEAVGDEILARHADEVDYEDLPDEGRVRLFQSYVEGLD